MKGIGSGQSKVRVTKSGQPKAGVASTGVVRAGVASLCGQRPGGLRSANQRARRGKNKKPESFVLRTHIVGWMGVKKLHID